MSGSAKANRFNIKRSVYAVITKDDATGVTCGKVEKFGDPMQVQLTPTYATGVLYGAGVKKEDMTKITGITMKFDVNKILIETRAVIGGHKYEDGILTEHKDDQAPDIAFGYEVEETGNHSEYVWLFKGKAKPIGSTVQQSTDNINFSTDSIDIGFIIREFDGKLKDSADTANASFTAEKAATYLDTVPGATLVTEGA